MKDEPQRLSPVTTATAIVLTVAMLGTFAWLNGCFAT